MVFSVFFFLGKSQPRKAVSGRELPNVRSIRKSIFKDIDRPSSKHNLFVMQFGQIVAHDTELTPLKSSGEWFDRVEIISSPNRLNTF